MNKFATKSDHTLDTVHNDWRDRRKQHYQTVKSWCDRNHVEFQTHKALGSLIQSSHSKLVYMLLWDMIPCMPTWHSINSQLQIQGKFLWVVTDNFLQLPNLSNVEFVSRPEMLGIIAWDQDEPVSGTLDKKYTCLMQRADSVRQTWFYFLHNNNLIDHGNVSYLCRQLKDYSELTGQPLFDQIHQVHELNLNADFERAYHALRPQVPYRNFDAELPIVDVIRNSDYNLVIETYASIDDENIWSFTEKSLREMQFASTPLIFCQKHGLSKLQSLGLMFPQQLIDLDSDDWPARQTKIIEYLQNDQLAQTSMTKITQAQHNRHVLHGLLQQIQQPDYFADLFERIYSK